MPLFPLRYQFILINPAKLPYFSLILPPLNLSELLADELKKLGRVGSQDVELLHHLVDRSFAVINRVGWGQLLLVIVVQCLGPVLLRAEDMTDHYLRA